jgi:LAO/AO transport system kinase
MWMHPANEMEGKKNPDESALKVNPGIDQPPSVNPQARKMMENRRTSSFSADDFISGILAGDRGFLSRAITLIESKKQEHLELAQEILKACLPHSGQSIRIGITGVPGVGKSSFIEAIGKRLTGQGHKLAVLAIDPSSERSKGSILGDKTRMEELSNDPRTFIRPSPSAGSLGGVAGKTRETMILCEAAGFDVIFIETVGVGQSETTVHSMVDLFLLLMLAGAGDELQGIKRGIMEMADIIAITKADGSNVAEAVRAAQEYRSALHLFPATASGWAPEVMTISAHEKRGLDELIIRFDEYFRLIRSNGYFEERRREQSREWMYSTIREHLLNDFHRDRHVTHRIKDIENKVMEGTMTSFQGAMALIESYRK